MRPVTISKALAAASATAVAAGQGVAGAGNLTINGSAASGGVATLDTQRRVLITCAGNASGTVFTVYGANEGGAPISEAVQGVNTGTASTNLDFLTVTRVTASAAAVGNVSIGTNATGSTPWKNPSVSMAPFNLPVNCTVSGSVTYSLEYTQSDYWTPVQATQPTPIPTVFPTLIAAETAAANETFDSPVLGWRLTVTAGTGTVTGTAVQAGIVNY